jgi:hypothetical protein
MMIAAECGRSVSKEVESEHGYCGSGSPVYFKATTRGQSCKLFAHSMTLK